jgi:cell division septum initiation protein DivIVA
MPHQTNTMTKQEELAALDAFIKQLEEQGDSYIAPWLRSSLPSVTRAIKSDIMPNIYTMNVFEFQKHREDMIETAKRQAEDIIQAAKDASQAIANRIANMKDDAHCMLDEMKRRIQE